MKNAFKSIQINGILINNQVFHFNYITPEMVPEPADLVIFAVKNAELPQAIQDVKHHIGPETIILSHQTEFQVKRKFMKLIKANISFIA